MRDRRVLLPLALAGLVAVPSSCHAFDPAPRAEAVIVVDTDLPVPRLAGTLRVDVFRVTDDPVDWHGLRWTATNEFILESRRDWPASFGVTLDEGEASARFLVRLRVGRSGLTRSYRGDRFLEPPAAAGDPTQLFVVPTAASPAPRLLTDGADRTPPLEPRPSSSVDRVLLVDLAAEQRGQVAVRLEGDCAGIESDLAGRRTCDGGTLVPLTPLPLAPVDLPERGVATAEGTWPVTAGPRIPIDCDAPDVEAQRKKETLLPGGARRYDEEVCLPGGAFLFGESAWANGDPAHQGAIAGLDELRIVAMPRVFVDRHEFTVGRARGTATGAALAHNEGQLGGILLRAGCTYTTRDGVRDAYPLNCVNASQAEALCAGEGRRLTTTAVWLYALHNGYGPPTTWPWGDDHPTHEEQCAGTVVEREASFAPSCGSGLPAVDDAATRIGSHADISQRGVRDLAGSLLEIQSDAAWPFAARCWRTAARVAPTCTIPADERWLVGGAWSRRADYLFVAPFLGVTAPVAISTEVGFRCMRFVDPR